MTGLFTWISRLLCLGLILSIAYEAAGIHGRLVKEYHLVVYRAMYVNCKSINVQHYICTLYHFELEYIPAHLILNASAITK